MSDVIRRLLDLLEEADITPSLSMHCRSGVIGDLCRCWRCRGESGPSADESAAERDATIADRGARYGREVEGAMLPPSVERQPRKPAVDRIRPSNRAKTGRTRGRSLGER